MKRWTAMVALFALAVSAAPVSAQVTKLLDYTSTYRYNQVDDVYGTQSGWTNRVFTDTTGNWLGAQGLSAGGDAGPFGGVAVNNTLTAPPQRTPTTSVYYFRAHFNYSGGGSRAFLTFSNHIDDGAIFYLNGREIQRVRVAAGTPTHTTQATGTGGEGAIDVFTYLATNLVATDNVLAVSIHQSGTGSSDVLYGTTIWAESATITITNQPDSLTAAVNDAASFTVGASGPALAYRWQFRATPAAAWSNIGANTNFHNIASVRTNDAGEYRVVVSNAANATTSSVATLTVTSDIFPPDLVSAIPTEGQNKLVLTFDEAVLRETTTNINNYVITMVGTTNRLIVTNTAFNTKLVQLTFRPSWITDTTNFDKWVDQWTTNGSNYIVTIYNVSDSVGNVVVPGRGVGVSMWKDVIPNILTSWNYSYGTSLDGQNWTAKSYNEYTNSFEYPPYSGPWITDPVYTLAYFYGEFFSGLSYPEPKSTVIAAGFPTFYFRKYIVMPTNVQSIASLTITSLIDDGGAVYLNGQEIHSQFMPAKPWTYNTLATVQRGTTPVTITTPVIGVTNLLPGTNVIAAEMHPQTLNSYNEAGICFGLTLRIASSIYAGAVTNGPRPDLRALASVLPTSVATNTTFNCTLTATNIGQAAATNVQFTAVFPTNVTIVTVPTGCANSVVNGISTLTCSTNTSIPINQAFTKVVQARAGGATNTATIRLTVVQTPADSMYLNNTNNAALTITAAAAAAPDIAVGTTTLPAVVGVSSNINFTFSVTNLGATAASGVVAVYTNLPAGITVVSMPAGCASGSGIVTCTIGAMNAGTVQTKTMVVASSVARTLTNRVVVRSTPADTITANNVAQSTVIVSVQPQLGGFKALGTTNISMTVTSLVGVTYVLDYKPLLTTPAWTPVKTNVGTGGILTLIPPAPSPASPTRFYRVRAQ